MRQPARGEKIAEKYELIEEIGRGGMGVVWRAYAESLGLHCALKMVLPGFGAQRERARLLREARIAAKLRSPYIVNTYDVGEWEGSAFIAMELLEGEPLSQLLEQSGPLTPSLTIELMRQLALGLEKAHAAGLVHRDLKPDNIFVVEREPLLVKLLDFGVAKRLALDVDADAKGVAPDSTQLQSMVGAIIGTPRYMSPEQAQGAAELDFRSDLWALAVIAFECLTGTLPFEGDTWPHLLVNVCIAQLPTPSQRNPALPPAFDAFWQTAASRDPAQRPASARAFADQLRQALTASRSSVPQLAATERPSQVRVRSPYLWAGAALAGAAISSIGSYLFAHHDAQPPAAAVDVSDVRPSPPPTAAIVSDAQVTPLDAPSRSGAVASDKPEIKGTLDTDIPARSQRAPLDKKESKPRLVHTAPAAPSAQTSVATVDDDLGF